VSLAALDIYKAAVDQWFPAMTNELRLAQLWPVRMLAFVAYDAQDYPHISWTFEPLDQGASVEVEWTSGSVGWLEFPGASSAEVERRRPDLRGRYFHTVHSGDFSLFEIDAATQAAMHLLQFDLSSLRWTNGRAAGKPIVDAHVLSRQLMARILGVVIPPA
jgi:hypothetical protein